MIPSTKNKTKSWLKTHSTPRFLHKHIAFRKQPGIKKANTVREGSTSASTVILLSSNERSTNFIKKIISPLGALSPNTKYTLSNVQMVHSNTINWERGVGIIQIHSDDTGRLNHLERTQMIRVLESGRVSHGAHIRF